jgi:hypothetical protein
MTLSNHLCKKIWSMQKEEKKKIEVHAQKHERKKR